MFGGPPFRRSSTERRRRALVRCECVASSVGRRGHLSRLATPRMKSRRVGSVTGLGCPSWWLPKPSHSCKHLRMLKGSGRFFRPALFLFKQKIPRRGFFYFSSCSTICNTFSLRSTVSTCTRKRSCFASGKCSKACFISSATSFSSASIFSSAAILFKTI